MPALPAAGGHAIVVLPGGTVAYVSLRGIPDGPLTLDHQLAHGGQPWFPYRGTSHQSPAMTVLLLSPPD
jgi:hypothetical protein